VKVSYPLSLKISLWLLLNLVLLAAAAFAFLVAQGGFSFDSLVRGPAGAHFQELAHTLAREYEAAPGKTSRAVLLTSYEKTHGARFYVFHPDLVDEPTPEQMLPPLVVPKVKERPPVRPAPNPPARAQRAKRPPADRPANDDRPAGERPVPREDEPEGPPRGGPRAEDEARGRFVVRAGNPAAYWIGSRGNWGSFDGNRPNPAVVIARVDSWWGVIRFLNLQAWFFAAGGVFVFSLLFWLPLITSITRALRRLTHATEAIAEGHFDTRVPDQRRDELGHLGSSVNRMAARLDTLVNGQKRFLGDIAHELGSPIGRLQVATEILESRADPSLREHVADVREEVQQMATLVNELLAFTKAGLRPRDAELASVVLASLVQETLAREHAAARVVVSAPPDLTARADAALLSRALGNLIRNALRYTAATDAIRLTVARDDSGVSLVVEDEGPGVPPEALARLGEPFYRPETARTRETGGAGLGLAIVRSSVAACGGEILFSNRTPRGFRAEIRLAAG
jgi:two-component system sensor histidine kinase CpxA